MAKKNWGKRWGEESAPEHKQYKDREAGYVKTPTYMVCSTKGMQCLHLIAPVINQVKARILLGLKEFILTGVTGVPRSMVKGFPISRKYLNNTFFTAHYQGKGKWLIIVG